MCLCIHKDILKGWVIRNGCLWGRVGAGPIRGRRECMPFNMFWLLNHVNVLPI